MKKLEIWKFGIQVIFSTLIIGLCRNAIIAKTRQCTGVVYQMYLPTGYPHLQTLRSPENLKINPKFGI